MASPVKADLRPAANAHHFDQAPALEALENLVARFQPRFKGPSRDGDGEPSSDVCWSTVRKAFAERNNRHASRSLQDQKGSSQEQELRLDTRLVKLIIDLVCNLGRSAWIKDAVSLPKDVAVESLWLASYMLRESPKGPDDKNADTKAAGGVKKLRHLLDPHAAMRLLAQALPVTGPQDAGNEAKQGEPSQRMQNHETASLVGHLAEMLEHTSNLRTCSLAVVCLECFAQHEPAAVRAAAKEVASSLTKCLQHLSAALVGGNSSSSTTLRDVSALLQALPAVVTEVSAELQPSALTFLACLQPLSVLGAPYVMPGRIASSSVVPAFVGPPGLALAVSDLESDTPSTGLTSATEAETGRRGRGGSEDVVTAAMTLQAQCRVAALRNFAHVFRLWPKSYFGRWPLVLNLHNGRVCRTGDMPMLLSICQQDPSPKVRAAALLAVCALLGAPSVRSWPVPLEKEGVASMSTSSTSLTGQLAHTLRQSHALVFRLLQSSHSSDVQHAIRACGELATCTPYTKLQSGLLSELVRRLMGFITSLSELRSLHDGVPQLASAAVSALSMALRREDCSTELSACLFSAGPAEPGMPVADELLKRIMHLFCLPGRGSTTASQQAPAQPAGGKGRRSKGARGSGSPAASEAAEGGEPLIVQDCALLASRLVQFRPLSANVLLGSTAECFQQLVFCLVDKPTSVLKLRGFKLLAEFLGESKSPSPFAKEWCTRMVRIVKETCQPSVDISASVRAAAASTLPGLLLGAPTVAMKLDVWAILQAAGADTSASVRTTGAQAAGSLANFWFGHAGVHLVEQHESRAVLDWVCTFVNDVAPDVRSSAVTALASFATAALAYDELVDALSGAQSENPLRLEQEDWKKAVEATLGVCRDQSDKPRASAVRAVGCFVDLLEYEALKNSSTLHVRMASMLAEGVSRIPAKGQWNACNSAGKLLRSRTLLNVPVAAKAVLDILIGPLCHEMSSAGNLKVRIQATQALQGFGIDKSGVLWNQLDVDKILTAVCAAVRFVRSGGRGLDAEAKTKEKAQGKGSVYPGFEAPPGLKQPAAKQSSAAEERQHNSYLDQLRPELAKLAAWCTPTEKDEQWPPENLQDSLADVAPDLMSWSTSAQKECSKEAGTEEPSWDALVDRLAKLMAADAPVPS